MKRSLFILIFTFVAIIGFNHSLKTTYAVDAKAYTPLAPIYLGNTGDSRANQQLDQSNIVSYVSDVYKLIVGLATVLAILMIVLGGIQYMSTDAISGKKDGIERIHQALWGLLLVATSYVILNTISPDFVDIGKLFKDQPGLSSSSTQQSTPAAPANPTPTPTPATTGTPSAIPAANTSTGDTVYN